MWSFSIMAHLPAPWAAHGPGAVLQDSLKVSSILHMARDGTGYHIRAPVSETDPNRGGSGVRFRPLHRTLEG